MRAGDDDLSGGCLVEDLDVLRREHAEQELVARPPIFMRLLQHEIVEASWDRAETVPGRRGGGTRRGGSHHDRVPGTARRRQPEPTHGEYHGNGELSCRQLTELASDYLDGRLTPRLVRAVERHPARCPDCPNYVAQLRLTMRLTGELRSGDVPDELFDVLCRAWQEAVDASEG